MNLTTLKIQEVKLINPDSYPDFRGYMSVPFDATIASALKFKIIQINQGFSVKPYTLRGLHFQDSPYEQAKLVSCLHGAIYNVAVDVRKASPAFGQYVAEILTAENQKLMYIPKGFAHGYLTLAPDTLMQWCVDNDFCGEKAKCLKYDSCGIQWPVDDWSRVILSEKDRNGLNLEEVYHG